MIDDTSLIGVGNSSSQRLRRLSKGLFKLIAAVLMVVVVAELSLRAAALLVGPRELDLSGDAERVILCLGDSNTYGVFYPQEAAYPGQLQHALERRAPGRYQVVNLGLPGMNSSQIAVRLRRWIEQYRPHAVIVCAGINNFWNWSCTKRERQVPVLTRIMRSFRLYRLLLLLRLHYAPEHEAPVDRPQIDRVLLDEGASGVEHRNAETGEILIAHDGNISSWRLSPDQAGQMLVEDLEEMITVCEEYGTRMLLLTYPASARRPAHISQTVRHFADQHDVTLVDLGALFSSLLAGGAPRTQYFASDTDSHPNPTGYREIAVLIADLFEPQEERVYAFLDHLDVAQLQCQPGRAGRAERTRVLIKQDERDALCQPLGCAVVFSDLALAGRPTLEMGIGSRGPTWRSSRGVAFEVEVVAQGNAPTTIFSRHIHPESQWEKRRWFDETVDLSPYAQQTVDIVFRVTAQPAPPNHCAWFGWADPRLIDIGGRVQEDAP